MGNAASQQVEGGKGFSSRRGVGHTKVTLREELNEALQDAEVRLGDCVTDLPDSRADSTDILHFRARVLGVYHRARGLSKLLRQGVYL